MFSVEQKRDISDAVQKILRATKHPELPTTGEISFTLQVAGAEEWSFAAIQNNGAVGNPGINPHNELMASIPEEEGRGLIERAKELTGQSVPYAETLTPIMDLEQRMIAEFGQLKGRISLVEGKADGLIEKEHDPRVTPDDHLRKIVEDKWLQLDARLTRLETFFQTTIEDNLIQHHTDQLNNLATAIRQLGSPKVTGGD